MPKLTYHKKIAKRNRGKKRHGFRVDSTPRKSASARTFADYLKHLEGGKE